MIVAVVLVALCVSSVAPSALDDVVVHVTVAVREAAVKNKADPYAIRDAAREALTAVKSQVHELAQNNDKDKVAKEVASKVLKDEVVKNAIKNQDVAPRFVGALAVGLTQLVSEVVKKALTHY